jgi:hypothetical protein
VGIATFLGWIMKLNVKIDNIITGVAIAGIIGGFGFYVSTGNTLAEVETKMLTLETMPEKVGKIERKLDYFMGKMGVPYRE